MSPAPVSAHCHSHALARGGPYATSPSRSNLHAGQVCSLLVPGELWPLLLLELPRHPRMPATKRWESSKGRWGPGVISVPRAQPLGWAQLCVSPCSMWCELGASLCLQPVSGSAGLAGLGWPPPVSSSPHASHLQALHCKEAARSSRLRFPTPGLCESIAHSTSCSHPTFRGWERPCAHI